MSHARERPQLVAPLFALLILLAVAHNWGGIADGYVALCNWAGSELGRVIVSSVATN
jgi:hypothetical protein